jgi:hypothetical protein
MADKTKRLTLDVGQNFDELLSSQADSASTTKADIIRRAVATYAYLRQEAGGSGKITIQADDGSTKDLLLR